MTEEKKENGFVYLVGNSHIDAAWLWPIRETIEVCYITFKNVLDLMEKYPGFIYAQSSAAYYEWMEKNYPEIFERIKTKVKEGRWEIVGGMWIEPDCNMPSGESLVRQFLYGKRYFKEKFGVDVKVAWLPDSFGFPQTLPQIMKGCGIDYFLTQKLNWNDMIAFPYYAFKWVSPDGSSVIALQTVGSYTESVDEESINKQLQILKFTQGIDRLLVLYGKGDHGGGPTNDMLERAMKIIRGEGALKGKFAKATEYFEYLKSIQDKLPVVEDELYLQYHRGVYTTQARVKKWNRKAEILLEQAEKLSSIAENYGFKYPKEELEKTWKKLLLNQFHDIISGTCIPEVYEDVKRDFEEIFNTTQSIITEAVKAIAIQIDTQEEGIPIVVFNTLSWERDGVVEVPLDKLGSLKSIKVYDEKGQLIPFQIVEDGKVVFIARNIPPIGYKVYRVIPTSEITEIQTDLSVTRVNNIIRLENEFLRVEIDAETGLVKSIYDKKNEREILREPGNKIQVFEDYPSPGRKTLTGGYDAVIFDAWEVYIYQQLKGVSYVELTKPVEVKILEKGPVRARVQVKYVYTQEGRPDSTFIQEVILYHGIPWVEFKSRVDWHGMHRLVKVAFPLSIHSEFTTYETPYGYIKRRNPLSPNASLYERAKYEVPAQKWIDHTSENGDYGVALFNDGRYGFDVANDTIRMTILRSPKPPRYMEVLPAPDSEPTDQGEHELAYAIYPHLYDHAKALVARKAYEFNTPLIIHVEPVHPGKLPVTHSFIRVEPENTILTVVKKAEDSEDIVLRLYETAGRDTVALIHLYIPPLKAYETNMLEEEIRELEVKGNIIEIPLRKHEIKTVKITLSKVTGNN